MLMLLSVTGPSNVMTVKMICFEGTVQKKAFKRNVGKGKLI